MAAAVDVLSPAALSVESIKVTFPLKKGKTKVALHDVTASFAPNSLTAILGPSGSGGFNAILFKIPNDQSSFAREQARLCSWTRLHMGRA